VRWEQLVDDRAQWQGVGALLFAEGEVVLAVQGEGQYLRVVGEDLGGAVALVDVEVDDGETVEVGCLAEVGDGDSDIVKDAVALATIGMSMVSSTG
jgi:hypothetical protein